MRHAPLLALPLLIATLAQAQPGSENLHEHCGPGHGCGKSAFLRKLAESGYNADGSRPGEPFTPREDLDDTDVLHNNLDIEVLPAARSILGSNIMTVRSKVDDLTEFTFCLDTVLAISEVRFNDTETLTPVTTGIFGRRVTLPRPVARDEVFTLTIRYAGQPRTTGFGAVVFGNRVIYTLSEPWYSACWWPAKDGDFGQPGDNRDKATFDIAITVPRNLTAVSNGLLQSVTDLDGDRRKHHWRTNYPMSSYLACFAAAEYVSWTVPYTFQHADGTPGSFPLQFFATPARESRARTDAGFVPTIMNALRARFGEYPFVDEKYGIYEFEFGGGMEHQTMSGQMAGVGASITAHELAHQWWGDDVTCRTWSDIWLNESFASYGDALYAESLTSPPNPAAAASRIFSSYRPVVSGTVYQYDTGDLDALFDSGTVYGKGAMVLHQLRFQLGDETFFNILRLYRSRFSGAAATTDDFIMCVNEVAGRDMSPYFDAWVYGPGGPRVGSASTQVQINGRSYIEILLRQLQSPPRANFYPHSYLVRVGPASLGLRYRVTPCGRDSWHLLPLPDNRSYSVNYNEDSWAMFELHNGSITYTPGPPKIADASPGPAASVAAPVDAIRLTFSENITPSADHFSVYRDQQTTPVPFILAYDPPNQTATLTPLQPLTPGRYTVTISDAVTANGMALDGEISGTLPSGDGLAGGSSTYTFTVLCPADFNRDSFLDFFDYADFVAAFETGTPDADFNRDIFIDFFDFADFVTAFEQGC